MIPAALTEAVVGIDLGTSGVRAVVLTGDLAQLAEATRSYGVHLTPDGGAEQSAQVVWESAREALGEVARAVSGRARIRAVSFSGTASALAHFDGNDPEGNAWLWSDVRSGAEAAELRQRFGLDAFRRTGCPAHASYWPAKLRKQQGQHQGSRLAGIKDYCYFRLTGEWLCDQTTAAATGLYNSEAGTWDKSLCTWLEVQEAQLPTVVEPGAGRPILPEMAAELGLAPETLIVAGSVDGVLAHIGLGCFQAGAASCMVGTSGAVRSGATRRALDGEARTWTYPAGEGLWVMGGAVNNGGNVLGWLGNLLGGGPGTTPDALIALALSAKPGGPIFLPYLYGERSPLWREELRGSLQGLSALHGQADVARAVVEGISLGLAHVFRVLVSQAGTPPQVRASGGFLGSPAWLQLQADVFGVPLVVTDQDQAAAAGAAMFAWQAVGGPGLGDLSARVKTVRTYLPDAAAHQYYNERFAAWEALRRRIWQEEPAG